MFISGCLNWIDRTVRRTVSRPAVPVSRLFVDLSTITRHDAKTGIQRVVRSVCRELSKGSWGGLKIYPVAATKWQPYRLIRTNLLPHDGLGDLQKPLELGPGDGFLGLDLSSHLFPRHELQLRRWRLAGAEIGVVVYDLLPFTNPEWFNPKAAQRFARWLGVVGRRASKVLPISQKVASDFAAFATSRHPDRAAKISSHVLRLSGDIGLFRQGEHDEPDPVIDRMHLRPSLLMVGTVEPRKGHEIALAAHRRAQAKWGDAAPLLIIAGKPGWRTDPLQNELRSLDLDRDGAIWLENVCDERLDRLYRASRGLLVASLGEGYCLPLHEAQAYGKPALSRDLEVLRELESPAISYFHDDSPDALARAMVDFIAHPNPAPDRPDRRGWHDSVHTILQAMSIADRA